MLWLSPTTVLRSEPQYYDTYVAFDYRSARTEFLTEQEHAVLQYISEKGADIDDISRTTGMRHDRCEKFLQRMLRQGYVTDKDGAHGKYIGNVVIEPSLYERFAVPFLSAPSSADVFITDRCNLRCLHCFVGAENDGSNELSLPHLRSIFDEFEKMRVLEVRINGGEPLLHSQITGVIDLLKGRRFRRVLLTNGTLLSEHLADLLKNAETTPTVSLDGSTAEEHDLFRGAQGSFDLTIASMKLLQKKGMQYGVNCCLHRKNLTKHREIVDLAARYGASRIAFLDLKNAGRMRCNTEWVPSYSEYERALLGLMTVKMASRGKIDVALDTFLWCEPVKESIREARRGYVSCLAGKTRMSVDSDGLVYPCNIVVGDQRWNMGDTCKESLKDIWFSERWRFFRGGTKLTELRTCSNCKNLRRCHDFYCRLVPYVEHGDCYGPHPACVKHA
jgi:radical SAM protein with 4Fe4S-binding SPASM domain